MACLGGTKDDLVTNNGIYPKSNLDARLYGIKTPVGDLGLWYDYSFSKGGTLADGSTIPSTSGWAIGIGHTRTEWLGGYNRVSLQYGVGNSANFSTGVEYPTVYLQNAHTYRFTDSSVIQPKNKFAVQPVFIYRSQTDGNPANGTNTWISFGARARFGSSLNMFHWRLRRVSTTPQVDLGSTRVGYGRSRSLRRLGQAENSSAARCCRRL